MPKDCHTTCIGRTAWVQKLVTQPELYPLSPSLRHTSLALTAPPSPPLPVFSAQHMPPSTSQANSLTYLASSSPTSVRSLHLSLHQGHSSPLHFQCQPSSPATSSPTMGRALRPSLSHSPYNPVIPPPTNVDLSKEIVFPSLDSHESGVGDR